MLDGTSEEKKAKETWIDAYAFSGFYQVSDQGRVKSLRRWIQLGERWSGNKWRLLPERILRPNYIGKGYAVIGLCKKGKIKSTYVHRLVWESFRGPITKGLEINHKDGDKGNNRLDNLEVGTHRHNMKHASKNGLINIFLKGGNSPFAKLSDGDTDLIRYHYRKGKVTMRALANRFSISVSLVHLIINKKHRN